MIDQVQVLQVRSGLNLGEWYCSGQDYGKTRYLQRNGDWGDAVFYFISESEAKSILALNHPSVAVSHAEPQESFTPSKHESHDDDDTPSSFGLEVLPSAFEDFSQAYFTQFIESLGRGHP